MSSTPQSPDPNTIDRRVPAHVPPAQIRRARQPVSAVRPPNSSNGLTPALVWSVFCKTWKWVLPLGLILAVAAGAIVWVMHVPRYEAKALVKIEAEVPFIAFDDGRGGTDSDRYVQTQIETLRGPVVLNPLLARPEVARLPEIRSQFDQLRYLQEHLKVRQVGKSELYEIAYTSESAEASATVANLTVAEYLRVQNRTETERSRLVLDMLEKERLARKEKVDSLRTTVVNLAKDLTGRDPFGQGVITDISAYSPAGTLYQEITETDVALEVLKAELQAVRNAPIVAADKAVASGMLDLEISSRADVRRLEGQIAEVDDRIAQIKSKPRTKIGDSWESDPEYSRLKELASTTRKELDDLRKTIRTELIASREEQQKVEQQMLIALKTREIDTLKKKQQMLSMKLDDHLEDLKAGGAQSAELEFAKSELEREQKVFELIAARKLALQTESRAPARVTLMDEARVPASAIEPIPYKMLLVACSVALLLPLGLAVGREAVVRRIRDGEQLATEAELPLLGEVARLPTRKVDTRRKLLAPQQRDLLVYTESIDSLRTNLALTEQVGMPGQCKIVAICSAVSGEGKTNVATSLAMSISQASSKPTLIIDADLRDSDVAHYLNVPAKPGVTEVLTGKADIADAIHRVGDTRTYVLPAGANLFSPHRLTEGTKIQDLLKELRESFGTIVIDTPPVLAASESLVFAKAADLVVFCSLAEVSRSKQVRAATERLDSTGANVAGAVLSGVSLQQYVYRYGKYAAHQHEA